MSYYYERLWSNTRNCKAGISVETIHNALLLEEIP